MAGWHRVEIGETMSSLAHDAGLLIETIWNDPNNSELRTRRETWDRVSPGDDVYLRDAEQKTEAGGTGQTHRFRKKSQLGLVIRIELDPQEASTQDDRFVLKSQDGSYSVTKTVRDDLVPGDRFIDLHYSGLERVKSYTLEVDPGAEGEPYNVFEDIPYDELAGLSRAAGTDFDSEDRPSETAAEDDSQDDDEPYPDEPDDE